MAFIDSMRSQFFLTLGLTVVVILSYSFIKKTNNKQPGDQFSSSEKVAK
jgi:GABA permease